MRRSSGDERRSRSDDARSFGLLAGATYPKGRNQSDEVSRGLFSDTEGRGPIANLECVDAHVYHRRDFVSREARVKRDVVGAKNDAQSGLARGPVASGWLRQALLEQAGCRLRRILQGQHGMCARECPSHERGPKVRYRASRPLSRLPEGPRVVTRAAGRPSSLGVVPRTRG